MDGAGVGPVGQVAADLPLDGRENQPFVCILRGGPDKLGDEPGGLQGEAADQSGSVVAGEGHSGLQNAFLLAPVDGQNLMVQQPGDGLGKVVVKPIDGVRIRVLGLAGQKTLPVDQVPESFADIGATVLEWFGLSTDKIYGKSFLKEIIHD